MILAIIISIVAGIILGMITGLIPGLHTNLVSTIIISLVPSLLLHFTPIILVVFIVSMSITNIFLEFIPSTYLGAPNEETTLSTLPAHELLLSGNGHKAIFLSSTGSFIGLIVALPLAMIFIMGLEKAYPFFNKMMAWILIWVSIFLIVENKNKLLTAMVFIFSGFLGIASLNLNITQPLLPLLTGLFGVSGLLYSIDKKTEIPLQNLEKNKIDKKIIFKPLIAGSIVGPFCSFLPGIGGSQATIIGAKVVKNLSREQFLILNGMINSLLMSLSFVVLFILQKVRTGSAATISELLIFTKNSLSLILLLTILIGVIGFVTSIVISKLVANLIGKINYTKISWGVIIFLTGLIIITTGPLGFLVLAVSTLLGLACQQIGVRKGILMGCLLIPTILIYLPF